LPDCGLGSYTREVRGSPIWALSTVIVIRAKEYGAKMKSTICFATTLCCAAVLLLVGFTPASGEIFVLANGGRLEGDLINTNEVPRQQYIVETNAGARIVLQRSQVSSVTRQSPALKDYELLLPKMPITLEGHWTMSEWCREKRLVEQRTHHLEQVLAFDSGHERARYALGYSKIAGKWIKQEDFMKKNGYIRYEGGWKSKQEILLEEKNNHIDIKGKEWRKKITMWRTWLIKSRGKQGEALASIKAIRDPLAAAPVADILEDETNRDLKLLLIEVLAKLKTGKTIGTFAKMFLYDNDANVRDRCIDELSRFGKQAAIGVFIKSLASKDNRIVNRAAIGLGVLSDPATTLALIDALITKHKYKVGGGGGISTSFGQGGGGGLGVGGGPQIIERELQNKDVLTALNAIHTGVNFGYDKQAWKRWYAQSNTPPSFNLRRSD
jgi:hypothetical protein